MRSRLIERKPDARAASIGRRGDVEALQAVDGALHPRVEVLHPHRHAIEAERTEQPHLGRIGRAWIDLDAVLAVGSAREARVEHVHQAHELRLAQQRRRAAAEVELLDAGARQVAAHQIRLERERLQVGRDAFALLGRDLVAAAVVADRVAERQVHVQRQRHMGGALLEPVPVGGGIEGLDEAVGRRIRRVARAGNVEAPQQRRRRNLDFRCGEHGG